MKKHQIWSDNSRVINNNTSVAASSVRNRTRGEMIASKEFIISTMDWAASAWPKHSIQRICSRSYPTEKKSFYTVAKKQMQKQILDTRKIMRKNCFINHCWRNSTLFKKLCIYVIHNCAKWAWINVTWVEYCKQEENNVSISIP